MKPLHDTRATPDVLLEVSRQLATPLDLPWQTFEEMLTATFMKFPASSPDADAWTEAQEKGGWWGTPPAAARGAADADCPVAELAGLGRAAVRRRRAAVPDAPAAVCLVGVPRRLAGAPAVAAGTARSDDVGDVEQLGRDQSGDGGEAGHRRRRHRRRRVRRTARCRLAAVLTPGIAPDIVAMPTGQGHRTFTRYASGRGAIRSTCCRR